MNTAKFNNPFTDTARKFRSFRRNLPDAISTIAVGEFKENFNRQGYINRNGVLIPWRKIKAVKKKKKGILIDTGRLKRSLRKAPSYNTARVVSDLDYAAAHNEGFKGNVRIKSHKRKGSPVRSHTRNMNLPKRQFMGDSQRIDKEIEKHIFTEIDKLWT